MKRSLLHIVLVLMTLLSCIREEQPTLCQEGLPVDVELRFGPVDAIRMDVETKTTLGIVQESGVYNLYIFIFDAGGKKLYGHFFDGGNFGADSEGNWWEVSNMSTAGGTETHGTIHLKTATKMDCTIVGIANINVEMLDISPAHLSTIQSLSKLEELKVESNNLDIENTGFFLMTGRMDDVDIVRDESAEIQQISDVLNLRRLESKIQFNVQVAPGSPISMFTPSKWEVVNMPRSAFLLEHGGYADRNDPDLLQDAAVTLPSDFSRSGEKGFETRTVTADYYSGTDQNHIISHGFSFYMMENRHQPLNTPASYADRDRQQKLNQQDHGAFSSVENGDFQYADPRSAYVVITGKLVMDVVDESVGATLYADVRYVIHLGDFSESVTDFNVFRNHNYIYNIYIQGVNDILAEVEANYNDNPARRLDEPEPGASGKVAVSLEEIFSSDAHYSSHVISFHAKNLDPDNITWYVETPFNPSGAQPTLNSEGHEITTGIDYEWVEFRVNEKDPTNNRYFDDKRQLYQPRGKVGYNTMNVTELVAYLKAQRKLYAEDAPHWNDPDYVRKSAFDDEVEKDENGQEIIEDGHTIPNPKISVTAFVNEYYYDEDPIRPGRRDPNLWKSFVNKPMRFMHILSKTERSADGESITFGASFTIQQRSIQTIYNISNSDLHSAWGVEYTDDELESGAVVYWKGIWQGKNMLTAENRGNTSQDNGRENSLKEWSLLNPNGSVSHLGMEGDPVAEWGTYLNLTANNETPLLRKDDEADYRYLRYSCMSRNRDNNGNGVIDQDEVRWYMGSDRQLMGLFMGAYGIEGDARLYQVSAEDRLSDDRNVWRQHVIASTRYPNRTDSNLNARVIWAEEGLNGSDLSYYGPNKGSTDYFSTRCVRNLGYYTKSDGTEEDITHADPSVTPDPFVITTRLHINSSGEVERNYTGGYDNKVFYEFDCSRINTASLREKQSFELVNHDENNKAACLSEGFISIPVSQAITVPESISFLGVNYEPRYARDMNRYLDATWGLVSNPFCPEGYRLPNVREDAMLWNFIPANDLNYFNGTINHSRTHWSFGVDGTTPKSGLTSWGWSISKEKILMADVHEPSQRTTSIRCVRDTID